MRSAVLGGLMLLVLQVLWVSQALAGVNQWTAIGPYGGTIKAMAVSPDFAGDHTVLTGLWPGLFVSHDGAGSWEPVAGLEEVSVHQAVYSPAYAVDRTAFVSGDRGLYRTTDAGASWTRLSILSWPDWNITGLALSPDFGSDRTLLAGDANGVLLRSTDGGDTWATITYGNYGISTITSAAFATAQEVFFVLNGGIVFKSTDGGATWTAVPLSPVGSCNAIVPLPDYGSSGTVLFATSLGGKVSTDRGGSWSSIPGLTGEVFSFALSPSFASDHVLYAGSTSGVHRSADGGGTWSQVLAQGPAEEVRALPGGTSVLAAAQTDVMKSDDAGQDWDVRSTGILGVFVRDLVISRASNGTMFAATSNGGVFRSTDGGAGWTRINEGLSDTEMRSIAISPDYGSDGTLLAGTVRGGVFRSTDGGESWSGFNTGIDWLAGFQYPIISDLAFSPAYDNDGTLLCAAFGKGVYATRILPTFWSRGTGLPADLSGSSWALSLSLSPDFYNDGTAFVGFGGMNDQGGIFRSTDHGATWSPSRTGLANIYGVYPDINSLAVSPFFYDDDTVLAGTYSDGVFRSTDGGASWSSINGDLGEQLYDVRSVAYSPGYDADRTLFLAEAASGIYRNDGGSGWSLLGAGMPRTVGAVVPSPAYADDHTLFAGTSRGVYAYTIDDRTPPTSVITSPVPGAQITRSSDSSQGTARAGDAGDSSSAVSVASITITQESPLSFDILGTASDGGGSGVSRVEVSLDDGATWVDAVDSGGASRFASWRCRITLLSGGSYLLRSRATDNFGNVGTPSAAVAITVGYTLSAQAVPAGGGTVLKDPDMGGYFTGTVVRLTATPSTGYVFTGWSGDAIGTQNPLDLVMEGNRQITASFAKEGLFLECSPASGRLACTASLFSAGVPLSGKTVNFSVRKYSHASGAWPTNWTPMGKGTTVGGSCVKSLYLLPGRYQVRVVYQFTGGKYETQLSDDVWGAPRLSSPVHGAVTADPSPIVSWSPLPEATGYVLQTCGDWAFAPGSYQETADLGNVTTAQVTGLVRGTRIFWRVVGLMPGARTIPSLPRSVLYREGTTLDGLFSGLSGNAIQPEVTLTAHDPPGGAVTARLVIFSYRVSTATAWKSMGYARTGPDGGARMAKPKALPAGTYDIRAVFRGDASYGAAPESILSGLVVTPHGGGVLGAKE